MVILIKKAIVCEKCLWNFAEDTLADAIFVEMVLEHEQ